MTHTVALADPTYAMTAGFQQSLIQLSNRQRKAVAEALEDWYWNSYVVSDRGWVFRSVLGGEGEAIPEDYLAGSIHGPEDAVGYIEAIDPAWRIDSLEAIQDFLSSKDGLRGRLERWLHRQPRGH